MTFAAWLDTLIEEKGIEGRFIEVEGDSGLNIIPMDFLIEAIKSAPKHEQAGIKNALVRIDFSNGDVMGYFNHLAKAIAA